jgi:hypothetical protein
MVFGLVSIATIFRWWILEQANISALAKLSLNVAKAELDVLLS